MTIPVNIILEDSYVLGWKFTNNAFHLLGEFRNTHLEKKSREQAYSFKWETGELKFSHINSVTFSKLIVNQGKDGELDFGSPDITLTDHNAEIELCGGNCILQGKNIEVEYSTDNPR